jgi:hypothetical protein
MSEHPYRRVSPEDQIKQKQLILNDMDRRAHNSVLDKIGRMFQEARDRKLQFMNPPPSEEGAKVVGIKPQTET